MTATKTLEYPVDGGMLVAVLTADETTIEINMTLTYQAFNPTAGDHAPGDLYCTGQYLDLYLPHTWTSPEAHWWERRQYHTSCQYGSQARRILHHMRDRVEDAIHCARLAYASRCSEIAAIS